MIILLLFLAGLGVVIAAPAAKIEEAYGYSDCGAYHDIHDYDPRPRDAPKCSIAAIEEAIRSETWQTPSLELTGCSQRFTRFFCDGVPGHKMREFRRRIINRLLVLIPNVTVVRATTCFNTNAAGVAQDDEVCRIRCGSRSLVHEFQVERAVKTCIYAWEWPEYRTTNEFKYDDYRRINSQCKMN